MKRRKFEIVNTIDTINAIKLLNINIFHTLGTIHYSWKGEILIFDAAPGNFFNKTS